MRHTRFIVPPRILSGSGCKWYVGYSSTPKIFMRQNIVSLGRRILPWMTPKASCHKIAKDFARKADENGQYFVSDGNSHGTRPSVRPLNGQSRYKFVEFSHIIFKTIIVVPFMDTDSNNFHNGRRILPIWKSWNQISDASPLSHRYRTGSSVGRCFRMEPRGEVYRSYIVSYKIWHTVVSGSMYSQASITSGSVITLRMLLSVIRRIKNWNLGSGRLP